MKKNIFAALLMLIPIYSFSANPCKPDERHLTNVTITKGSTGWCDSNLVVKVPVELGSMLCVQSEQINSSGQYDLCGKKVRTDFVVSSFVLLKK